MSLLSLIPLAGKLIGGLFAANETKQAIKKIKNEGAIKIAQAKVNASIEQASGDSNSAGELDKIALQQVGFKDEYLMFVITIPTILAFIPSMVEYVDAGFKVLEQMPVYYQYMLGGVYIYVFGFKRIMLKAINAYVGKMVK